MSGDAPKPERRLFRIVLKRMGGPFTLPLLGGSLLAAVVAGIHLGESTVGLIDPIHYQGPAVHPRDRGAALDERNLARSRSQPVYADLYGWDEGRAARMAECGDCGEAWHRARTYSATVPYFGGPEPPPNRPEPVRGEAWDSSPPRERVMPDEALDPVPEDKRLERYAHFPLTYEDAAFPAEDGEKPVDSREPYRR